MLTKPNEPACNEGIDHVFRFELGAPQEGHGVVSKHRFALELAARHDF